MTQYMQEAGAMKQATIADAPAVLNTNDKAMWVLGFNAAPREWTDAQIEVMRRWFIETHACWFTGASLRAMLAAVDEGTLTAGKQGGDGVAAGDKPLEPIAWVSHTADGKPLIPTFDRAVAESWKAKGGDVRPLVYAPGVASDAPMVADLRGMARQGLIQAALDELTGNVPEQGMARSGYVARAVEHLRAALGVALPDGSRDAQDPTRGEDEQWRPMKTAPKDGTIVRLLVDYRGDGCHPLEDAEVTHTIGGNTDDHTGLKEGWKFAGWSWEQDCFTEGRGKPIGWLPLAPSGVKGTHPMRDGYTGSVLDSAPNGHKLTAYYATREQADAAQAWLAAGVATDAKEGDRG